MYYLYMNPKISCLDYSKLLFGGNEIDKYKYKKYFNKKHFGENKKIFDINKLSMKQRAHLNIKYVDFLQSRNNVCKS